MRNGEAGKESLDRSAKGRTRRGEIGPISWDPGEEEVRHGESVLWRIEFRKEKGRIADFGLRNEEEGKRVATATSSVGEEDGRRREKRGKLKS